jgi:hypothetical protein
MKPFPNRTNHFHGIRLSPDSYPKVSRQLIGNVVHGSPRDPAYCQPRLTVVSLESAQALRPATALPVALGGRHSTGYYGLSAPVPALGISRPTIAGAGPGPGVARVASVVLP